SISGGPRRVCGSRAGRGEGGVVHRRGVFLVLAATLLAAAAGAAWGLARPVSASSAHKQAAEDEDGQVHGKAGKAVGGAGASNGLRAAWVIQENARPGTSDWRLTPSPGKGMIEGYADKVSAQQGDNVTLYVNTDAPSFTIEAYRIGYYQGLGGRLVWRSGELQGVKQ